MVLCRVRLVVRRTLDVDLSASCRRRGACRKRLSLSFARVSALNLFRPSPEAPPPPAPGRLQPSRRLLSSVSCLSVTQWTVCSEPPLLLLLLCPRLTLHCTLDEPTVSQSVSQSPCGCCCSRRRPGEQQGKARAGPASVRNRMGKESLLIPTQE